MAKYLNEFKNRSPEILEPRNFEFENSKINENQQIHVPAAPTYSNISKQTKINKSSFDVSFSQIMKPPISKVNENERSRSEGPPVVRGVKLHSVDEVPRIYQNIFTFPYFNILQSLTFDEVLYTDKSIVASAPTGSGKTVIFELAVIRLLMKSENVASCGKIVYMAPMKALCTERFQDWATKFRCHGLSCLEVTGDSEFDDLGELLHASLICTTPEKWDSMSRRWKDNKQLFHRIKLFLIDEIHTLNDRNRGATVEAVVSRMKILQSAHMNGDEHYIRFIAVSATMPNYSDIAEWLGQPSKPATAFNLGESFRPVKLEKIVLGFPFKEGTSDFRFDMNLSYRLRAAIDTYSHSKPTLVFCSSRKSVVQSADVLARDMRISSFSINFSGEILQKAAMTIHEHKLAELLQQGIGLHHAGLDSQDRHVVEELFKASHLPILVSTSTLAMGVNLPAHLVVIKSTHFYNLGAVQEYSDMQILQMMGRAGRPQFDISATAVIMTKSHLKTKYESLVNGTQLIESSLHKHLIEHLNAEIVLGTISEISHVIEWLRHTFLYVRALKNPRNYGLPSNMEKREVEKKLIDLCLEKFHLLTSLNLVSIDESTGTIQPTGTGKLMARYCIAYKTMNQFHKMGENHKNIAEMLEEMAHCAEFEDIQLRTNEKKILNSLNKDKNKETIRFPMQGKIKTGPMKVYCLIQAQLSCMSIQDFSLSQDMAKIFRVGQRVAKCLMELIFQGNCYSALLHAILIYKAFKCKLWFDSRYVARQLDGIGPTMSLSLANSGLSSFQKIEQANARDIELIVNRHPPFGNQIKEAVLALPRYELSVEQMKGYKPNKAVLMINVDLANHCILESRPSNQHNHQSILIIGDAEDKIVLKWRVMDAPILRYGALSKTVEVTRNACGTKLTISLLSQDWVGLDIQTDYDPIYSNDWFGLVKTPTLPKTQTLASKLQAAIGNKKTKRNLIKTMPNSSENPCNECQHKCLDKMKCGHKCCKPNGFKRPITTSASQQGAKLAKKECTNYQVNKSTKAMLDIIKNQREASPQGRITIARNEKNVKPAHYDNVIDRDNAHKYSSLLVRQPQPIERLIKSMDRPSHPIDKQVQVDERIVKKMGRPGSLVEITSQSNESTPEKDNCYGSTMTFNDLDVKDGIHVETIDPIRTKRASYNVAKIPCEITNNNENKILTVSDKHARWTPCTNMKRKQKFRDNLFNGRSCENSMRASQQFESGESNEKTNKTEFDLTVNPWADLDAFRQSRQDFYRNGRPLHLQVGYDAYDDDIVCMGENKDNLIEIHKNNMSDEDVPQTSEHCHNFSNDSDKNVETFWPCTASSDEELCKLVPCSPKVKLGLPCQDSSNERENFWPPQYYNHILPIEINNSPKPINHHSLHCLDSNSNAERHAIHDCSICKQKPLNFLLHKGILNSKSFEQSSPETEKQNSHLFQQGLLATNCLIGSSQDNVCNLQPNSGKLIQHCNKSPNINCPGSSFAPETAFAMDDTSTSKQYMDKINPLQVGRSALRNNITQSSIFQGDNRPRTPHRYGHVKAWTKSSNRLSDKISTKPTVRVDTSRLEQENSQATWSLFDGIF